MQKAPPKNKLKSFGTGAVLRLFLTIGLALEAIAAGPSAIISRQDRLELTGFYTNLLRQKITGELRLLGVTDHEPSVSLSLEFDDNKVGADADAWRKNQDALGIKDRNFQSESVRKNISDLMKRYNDEQAALRKDQKSKSPDKKKNNDNEPSEGIRLGRLNVDITNTTITEIISKVQEQDDTKTKDLPQPAAAPLTLAINVPSPTSAKTETFAFKAADYITKINVEVSVPADTPKEFSDGLPAMVAEFLDFKSIAKGAKINGWVKVNIAPMKETPPATPQMFLKNIWRPESTFISTLTNGLILGFFALLAMFIAASTLSRGIQTAFANLGKEVASLKPAEASKDEGSDDIATTIAVKDQEGDQRGSFDQATAGQAMARDMQNIRGQMTTFIAENTFLCAEYLSDMFYNDSGLADFRDLLSFMSYAPLKPSLDQLPRMAVERLEIYIEEHRETPPNMLNGAEIAQRMYGECVSKATLRDDGMRLFDPVRAALIKIEDAVVSKYLSEADSVAVSVLLKILSVERGNRLIKSIPAETLKDATKRMDQTVDSPDQVIATIITKLEQTAATVTERSQAQKRLIMRLVKSASPADEGTVYDLIPAEDWEMKRQIINTRMFYRDVIFVPEKLLGIALSTLSLSRRAEIVVAVDENLRRTLLASVGLGTKKAELLQTEVDQLQKNARKLADVTTRKEVVIESFLNAVRKVVSSDKTAADRIILAQAKALGISPPENIILPNEDAKAAA